MMQDLGDYISYAYFSAPAALYPALDDIPRLRTMRIYPNPHR